MALEDTDPAFMLPPTMDAMEGMTAAELAEAAAAMLEKLDEKKAAAWTERMRTAMMMTSPSLHWHMPNELTRIRLKGECR